MAELFEKLGVDWKLLIAQLVNFAILFWVLKRYAYKPILSALDKRSSTIAKSLDDAKHIEHQVEALEVEKTRVLSEARTEAGKIVEQARKDAEAFAAKTREDAQASAQQLMATTKQHVTEMKDAVMEDAKSDLADLVVAATEKVIRMKIAGAADKKMVEGVLKKTEDAA